MKKLSKIKLHNIVEMTDSEMKKVVGGWSPTKGPEPSTPSPSDYCPEGETLYDCTISMSIGGNDASYSGVVCAETSGQANGSVIMQVMEDASGTGEIVEYEVTCG